MAERETWRANVPEDWQGKQADEWDGEIPVQPIVWSTVAVAVSFVIAYFVNLAVLQAHEVTTVEEPSALVEASERYLPPSPLLQSHPEEELEQMFAELDQRLSGYGWTDELDGRVHIPIERGMDLVLARHGAAPATGPEPAQDEPVDVGPDHE